MELIRNYLTAEEMFYIVEEVSSKENPVEREIIKIGVLAQILIKDLEVAGETCDTIYNYIYEKDCIDLLKSVKNYEDIDKFVSENIGMTNMINNFLDDISAKIDVCAKSVDAENIQNIINQFSVITKKKEVE